MAALSTRVALAVIVCAVSIAGTFVPHCDGQTEAAPVFRLVLTPSGKCVLRAADFSCSPERGPPCCRTTYGVSDMSLRAVNRFRHSNVADSSVTVPGVRALVTLPPFFLWLRVKKGQVQLCTVPLASLGVPLEL
jgi:hypothetical protein